MSRPTTILGLARALVLLKLARYSLWLARTSGRYRGIHMRIARLGNAQLGDERPAQVTNGYERS